MFCKRLYWAEVNSPWANVVKEMLPPIDSLVTFGSKKLKSITTQIQSQFWRDVISSWSDFCDAYKPDDCEILSDKLWYSDYTKFKKSIVRNWDNKGLRFIADLFCKQTGEPLSRNCINETFGLNMTFLCYSSLIRSIPSHICRSSPKSIKYPVQPFKIALLGRNRNISRYAYKEFVNELRVKNTSGLETINRKWNRDIAAMQEGTLLDVRMSTRNTYLQTFHYRIFARIISTNTFLFRIGRSDTSLCTFCKSSNETLKHILWDCRHVIFFIQEIKLYLQDTYTFQLNINLPTWIFPTLANNKSLTILIITLAKLAIFKARNSNCKPSIRMFHNLLKFEAEKEKNAAKRQSALNDFFTKWENVSSIVQE